MWLSGCCTFYGKFADCIKLDLNCHEASFVLSSDWSTMYGRHFISNHSCSKDVGSLLKLFSIEWSTRTEVVSDESMFIAGEWPGVYAFLGMQKIVYSINGNISHVKPLWLELSQVLLFFSSATEI